MPNNKTKRGGCSVFAGKTKKKDENALLLKKILRNMPPDVSEMLMVLLKKEPQFIKDKIKGLKLDQIEKMMKEKDNKLMKEVNKLKLPEQKVKKFTELRKTEITKEDSMYNIQEQTLLIEELDRVNNIFNPSAANAGSGKNTATAKNPPKSKGLLGMFSKPTVAPEPKSETKTNAATEKAAEEPVGEPVKATEEPEAKGEKATEEPKGESEPEAK